MAKPVKTLKLHYPMMQFLIRSLIQPALKLRTKLYSKSISTESLGCDLALSMINPSDLGFVVCVGHSLVPGFGLKNSAVEWSWVCQVVHEPCDFAVQSVACETFALELYNPGLICYLWHEAFSICSPAFLISATSLDV